MNNYLMWVCGEVKILDFIEEGLRLGISRKLPFLPRQLNKGSKIHLASLQITHVRNPAGKLRHENKPVIFGDFTVDHVEFIVDEINSKIDETFTKKGLAFCQITKVQARKEPRRMDGKRLTSGSMYAVNYPPDSVERVKERQGLLTIYHPYIEATGLNFFRGIKGFELSGYLKWRKTLIQENHKNNG